MVGPLWHLSWISGYPNISFMRDAVVRAQEPGQFRSSFSLPSRRRVLLIVVDRTLATLRLN